MSTREVLTIGSFDPVHADHVALFRRCEKLGTLLVGVNTDAFIREYRHVEPMFPMSQRIAMVGATGFTACRNDGPGRELIEFVRPEFLVVGNDWLERDYLKQIDMTVEDIQRLGITVVFTPRGTSISGTELRERIRD